MKLNSFEENIHSNVFFLVSLLFACFVFTTSNYYCFLVLYLFSLILALIQGVSIDRILVTMFTSFVFSFFCAYFILFFPNEKYAQSEMIRFFEKDFPKELALNQFRVFIQVGLVSNISFLYMRIIKFEKVMIYLMKKKWISAHLGYPILLALNSIEMLKTEYEKININAKMRGFNLLQKINMLFPLLVYAIRHADRGAMSLITRGLNEEKAYYFDVSLALIDKILMLIFIILVFVCTAYQFFL